MLALLNQHLDPTVPTLLITPILKGTRLTQWHKNVDNFSKIRFENTGLAWQEQPPSRSLLENKIPLKHVQKTSSSNGRLLSACSLQANLAAQYVTVRSESRLSNYMLLLHSATLLDLFYSNFYGWCLKIVWWLFEWEWWLGFFSSNFKEENFLLDSLFSLSFPKIIETMHQARGFFGGSAAACSPPWENLTTSTMLLGCQ